MFSHSRGCFVFLISAFFSFSSSAAFAQSANITQTTMIQTLDQVASIFSQQYAPVEFKAAHMQWSLQRAYEKARVAIETNPQLTRHQFQKILREFTSSTRDHHVSIHFYSTEKADLPFSIRSAKGRYFIVAIDRTKAPEGTFPFDVGTEVTHFGGKPVSEVIHELLPVSGGTMTLTEHRIAEDMLTIRHRRLGQDVPRGSIEIRAIDKNGASIQRFLHWNYVSEFVPQGFEIRNHLFPQSPAGIGTSLSPQLTQQPAPQQSWVNPFAPGARRNFLPRLGDSVTEATQNTSPFDFYFFQSKAGKRIGYLRIPSFSTEKSGLEETQFFDTILGHMNTHTDGLIIDLLHNPGGSMLYMNALISRLIDQPVELPRHQIMLTDEIGMDAVTMIQNADYYRTFAAAEHLLAPYKASGLEISFSIFHALVQGAREILSEIHAGRRLSRPLYIDGVDRLNPHSQTNYKKPLLILVDERSTSGGDFMPAILQDSDPQQKRIVIMGAQTAGAGGAVKSTTFPNQFGIHSISYTWTIAHRPDGRQLENNGVIPGVPYELTVEDLTSNFKPYAEKIVETMDDLIRRQAE